MSNPWLKKNPFMSMWLSTANSVAGSMRGQATAEAKRQVNAAIAEATRENLKVWNAAVKPAAAKPVVAKAPASAPTVAASSNGSTPPSAV